MLRALDGGQWGVHGGAEEGGGDVLHGGEVQSIGGEGDDVAAPAWLGAYVGELSRRRDVQMSPTVPGYAAERQRPCSGRYGCEHGGNARAHALGAY